MQDHQEDEEKTVDKGHVPPSTTLLLLQSGMEAKQLVLMASAVPWGSVTSWPRTASTGLCGDGNSGCSWRAAGGCVTALHSTVGLCDLTALE